MDDVDPVRVGVIIGSTREERAGAGIGQWFVDLCEPRTDLALVVLDLAGYDFPHRHPTRWNPEVARFVLALDACQAFVIITPEYNRSFPASLKQAIDYGFDEWQGKPVGFVSYGCRSDGRAAVDALRPVFTELGATTVRNTVSFDLLAGPTPSDPAAIDPLVDQLRWWALALRSARADRPYVC